VNPKPTEPTVSATEALNPWDALVFLGLLLAFLIEFSVVVI
jgi:hypothetical protein